MYVHFYLTFILKKHRILTKRFVISILQPRNIFLHAQDCHVRIGDFGLACKKFIADGHINTVTPINGKSGYELIRTGRWR